MLRFDLGVIVQRRAPERLPVHKFKVKRLLSALVIAAVAATSVQTLASADTIDSQVSGVVGSTDVQLYNNSTGAGGAIDLTAKSDGTDTTVRLEAGGGNNVAQVTFQVSVNGGSFTDLTTTSRNDDGAFSYEWSPADTGAFPGDVIDIRVFNAAEPSETDTAAGFILQSASAASTQAINIAAGEQRGYFQNPDVPSQYTIGVTGTTSITSTDPANRPCVAWMHGGGSTQGYTCDTSNLGNGSFEGVLRLTTPGYAFDDPTLPPTEADQLVVRAATDTLSASDDQTDDFETFTLYKQTLTSLTATTASDTVTVTVLDQNGDPIAGIGVYADSGASVGESDGLGQVRVAKSAAQYYYANADASDAFSPAAGDKRTGGDAPSTCSRVQIPRSLALKITCANDKVTVTNILKATVLEVRPTGDVTYSRVPLRERGIEDEITIRSGSRATLPPKWSMTLSFGPGQSSTNFKPASRKSDITYGLLGFFGHYVPSGIGAHVYPTLAAVRALQDEAKKLEKCLNKATNRLVKAGCKAKYYPQMAGTVSKWAAKIGWNIAKGAVVSIIKTFYNVYKSNKFTYDRIRDNEKFVGGSQTVKATASP
jgi:hypothetical protein